MINKVTIIGSGNIATQLSLAFYSRKIKIIQILSRNRNTGKKLANLIKADFVAVVIIRPKFWKE